MTRVALRRLSFKAMTQGWSLEQIAEIRKVSVRTVRRDIDVELACRRLEAPARYVHFQVQRLNKALRVAHGALDEGDLAAVSPMIRVVAALDRYHGLGPVRASGAPAASLPSAAAPKLALSPRSASKPDFAAAAEKEVVTRSRA